MRSSDWSSDVCSSDLDALRLCEESREEVECRGHAEGSPGNELLATSAEAISAHRKTSGGRWHPSEPGQLQRENESLQSQLHLVQEELERYFLEIGRASGRARECKYG